MLTLLLVLSLLLAQLQAASVSGGGLWRLRSQLETEALPLFQFATELSALLGEDEKEVEVDATSLLECEVVFNDYMGRLRDHYAAMFAKEAQDTAGEELIRRRHFYLKECRVAMQAALPRNACCMTWRFDGALAELQGDLDQVVHDVSDAAESLSTFADMDPGADRSSVKATSRLPSTPRFGLGALKQRWRDSKRLRWITAQSLLLLANFCQSEWVRRAFKAKDTFAHRHGKWKYKGFSPLMFPPPLPPPPGSTGANHTRRQRRDWLTFPSSRYCKLFRLRLL